MSNNNKQNVIIDYEEPHIATLTINHHPVNALTEEVLLALDQAFSELEQKKEIRAVILTAQGSRAFVAGADLNVLSRKNPREIRSFLRAIHDTFNRIETFPVPVICAINSHAVGNGCELAMVCDIRIASEEATFLFPECKLGVVSAGGATQRLQRLIPQGRALYYLLTSAKMTAQEAFELGFVDFIVPAQEVLPLARSIACSIAANAPLTVSAIKKLVKQGLCLPLHEALAKELEHSIGSFQTEDLFEGITAYLEKRVPAFKGR
ncbi:enoyl-CoA hydratase/isomerase family protein [Desulfofundulus sp. TPOSR]|uniref:enoyl-CoA hydratase/isomerase family protein n=1 Tax=Desulfofundulus sp. TPOSR TaxID=2714340 RepID=UPI00140D826E|nr:enoyl-CoA hydratase/isomerase family protein [Desulfofundulus sp. TPOSR]NHM25772.1 enoyl-CoA hydratase/isomerase family protein [Desulfofundulus sp. TPOSR]